MRSHPLLDQLQYPFNPVPGQHSELLSLPDVMPPDVKAWHQKVHQRKQRTLGRQLGSETTSENLDSVWLDLYCGTGWFGNLLGIHTKARTISIDRRLFRVRRGQRLSEQLGTTERCEFIHGPTQKKLVKALNGKQLIGISVFYPNPMRENHLRNRRFVYSSDFVLCHSKLLPGHPVVLVTDQEFYASETAQHLRALNYEVRVWKLDAHSERMIPRSSFEWRAMQSGQTRYQVIALKGVSEP